MDDAIPRSILVIALVLLGGFFAGSETALSNCNRVRMKSRAEDGEPGPIRVEKIMSRFDKALSTTLVCINVVYVLATSTATILAIHWFGPYGSMIATITMTLIIFICSETIPKNIAKVNSDAWAIAVSGIIYPLMILLTPVTAAFTAIGKLVKRIFSSKGSEPAMTEDDFKSMIETIEDAGAMESEESELIQSALEFSDLTAYHVLTPRIRITGLNLQDPDEVNREKIRQTSLSRLPVYDPDLDHIVGIVNTKTYLMQLFKTGRCRLEDVMSQPYTVPAATDLHTLFQEMCRRKQHMAIILDEWGGTLGLVTMEDILEELVGDMYEEDREEQTPFGKVSPSDRSDGEVEK